MTMAQRLDVTAEVASITATLAARRDPSYEWGMRRTVPSQQPAHAVRVPEIYRTTAEWRRAHKGIEPEEALRLCEALWATGWREERRVAIELIRRDTRLLRIVEWERLARWSGDIDNWEMIDHMAYVTGRRLIEDAALLDSVQALERSDNPWQRRLAVVTLIIAFMKGGVFREELSGMGDRLLKDEHPLVRKAVVWARDRLKKDHQHD